MIDIESPNQQLRSNPTPQSIEVGIENTEIQISEERKLSFYRQALLKDLDPAIFKMNPWRLGFMAVFFAVATVCVYLIAEVEVAWPLKLLCGIVIGICTGNMAFIGHELLHGTIVKNQKLQDIIFLFGVAPFFLSPTYWRFSHNRLHHGHSQKLIEDPDAFPNLRIFKMSPFMKFMFPYTPGSGHKRSLLYFFFWFTVHNFMAQIYFRFKYKGFDSMNHKRATGELVFQLMMAAGFLYYVGPSNWVWAFILPILVQNYWLMSYIATNHNLCPLTNVNDPLINTLSVTNHPVLEFLSLNFGYHVEHHIFPNVNGKHAKQIHRALVAKFPTNYKVMPKYRVIQALYRTPRIYKNARTLVHPETGATAPTL
ncbi:MAG: hypothetical protein HC883_01170 [Bdellovibrionaceae bacterium]|nr:hypothetical protein [Pseudobdellovibrionaceae bacterium]